MAPSSVVQSYHQSTLLLANSWAQDLLAKHVYVTLIIENIFSSHLITSIFSNPDN
jgi:hypothetical protein